MSKLLIAGVGPIPPEAPGRLFAPGLRAWIFAETLACAGHGVRLATLDFAQRCQASVHEFRVEARGDGTAAARLDGEHAGDSPSLVLSAVARAWAPDAVIALTDAMGEATARAGLGAPLWFDFLGAPMAERQQQAAVASHDGGLAAAWRTILPCLLSGDRFSTCSEAQRLAMIGELGACGRLNRYTAGINLVHSIPMGVAFSKFEQTGVAIRGPVVPKDAIILLWAGGFNTWTDVETLHAGVSRAMDRVPRLHFVAYGGAIPGHCETVFPRFMECVAAGPHADRFHLMGWAEPEKVQNAYLEADLAINIDCWSYEGLLGTRSRLLEWMRAGLPILTTRLCEFSVDLIGRQAAYGFETGDPESLASILIAAAGDPDGRRERARRAADLLEGDYANKRLLAPLLDWAAAPKRAPDLACVAAGAQGFRCPDNALAAAQAALLRPGAGLGEEDSRAERLRAALARLQGSRLVRLFMKLKHYPPEDV
jgi:glycosyltransferase involved in cell wall biosynthesis